MHDRRSAILRRLAHVVAIATCIGLSSGCSRAPQDPAASAASDIGATRADTPVTDPTTMRVALRLAGEELELVAAEPMRGDRSHRDPAREAEEALAGRLRLLRYRVLDTNGSVLATGLVPTSRMAIAEYQDPAQNQRIVREEDPLSSVSAAISVPYSPAMRALELEELQPQASAPPESWPAQPAQRIELPAGAAP